jgi:hypothetical protein
MFDIAVRRQVCLRPIAAAVMALILGAGAPRLSAGASREIQADGAAPAARTLDFVCDGGQRFSVTFDAKVAHLLDGAGRRATLASSLRRRVSCTKAAGSPCEARAPSSCGRDPVRLPSCVAARPAIPVGAQLGLRPWRH